MDAKSLEMLEFPRIREILGGYTSFSASRELAAALCPLQDYELITRLLRQTAEARGLLDSEGGFSVGGVLDVRDKVKIAALEGILDAVSLVEIQQTLAGLHELRRYLKGFAAEFPLLWEIAGGIAELRQIEKDIGDCLDPGGEVLDTASPALADIRRQLRETRSQILERLEDIVRSTRGQRLLQEDLVTEREGRYVLLVRTEFRHEMKGIVHDISNTGATVFMEPTATVGLGNAIRELVIEERREIERILRLLSAEVGAHAEDISRGVELAAGLDLLLAKARYARRIRAVEPEIIAPDAAPAPYCLQLVQARHPLLGDNAVPFSIEIGRDYSVLVITGPNTGGKTVTLKTIGLLSLMAQAGLPIPAAAESRLPIFDGVFADIGDEQSIEQTLSTFSWHMGNVVRVIKGATPRSLVLLDELGTSTDPAEGSALARAVLRYFRARGTLTVATTHYSDLKAFAHATEGLENASLEFDPKTLTPTYRLSVGIPGGSNAIATAARLGIPAEIIDDARGMLTGGSQEFEDLLANLMAEKQKITALQRDLQAERDDYARRSAVLTDEQQRVKAETRRAVQEARDAVIRDAAELHRDIRQAAVDLRKEKSAARMDEARRALERVREQLDTPAWHPVAETETPVEEDTTIRVGDTVRVREAGLVATVLLVLAETGEVEIQAGRTRMRLGLDSVVKAAATAAGAAPGIIQPVARSIERQLDLRGKRADEVEAALDVYLNDASRSSYQEVRIVHGFGTGTVRNIVRDFLARHPLVKSFRPGERDEGGDGATVVRF
jgi:DNA mismatch repair protein MutS2